MLKRRRNLGRLAAGLFVFIFAFCIWAGWYVYDKGFTKKWRRFVREEFASRGFEIDFRRLTLDPFQGLVARDLRIYDGPDRTATFARVNRMVLDINYANLLFGEPFLNAAELRDAELAIPLDPADPRGKKLEIQRLNAQILFPPHQVYVSHASAIVEGVAISLTGRLLNPESYTPAPQDPVAAARRTENLIGIIKTLRRFDFGETPPELEIRFNGDLAALEELYAEATLEAPRVARDNLGIENIRASLVYRDRRLTLTQLEATDRLGLLSAQGSFDTPTRKIELDIRSSIDLPAAADALDLAPLLKECVFYGTPSITLSARGQLAETADLLVVGHMTLGKFGVRSVLFEGLNSDFSWNGGRWYVRDFNLAHRTGDVTGSLMYNSGYKGTLTSSLDLTKLLPFVSGKTAEFLREWEFPRSPDIVLTLSGSELNPDHLLIEGDLHLGRAVFRGQPLKSGSARLRVENKAATYSNFRVEREEGVATGTFTYDFGNRLARLENVRSTLDPGAVALWITPDFPKYVDPYRFIEAPTIHAEGVVYYKGDPGTDLELIVDGARGMSYTFLGKDLPVSRISGRLLFQDKQMQLEDVEAGLFDGVVRGRADISLDKDAPGYAAKVAAESIDFTAFTSLYFDYDDSEGLMTGEFDFTGRGDQPRSLEGKGSVRVVNGNVFAIPWLGPMSGILNGIVPGMGYTAAREASATFAVANGTITTGDLLVTARGFEMIGDGELHYLDDRINFDMRINARGIPGVLLFPVSKLFEYRSDGTLSNPRWRPRNLPSL